MLLSASSGKEFSLKDELDLKRIGEQHLRSIYERNGRGSLGDELDLKEPEENLLDTSVEKEKTKTTKSWLEAFSPSLS